MSVDMYLGSSQNQAKSVSDVVQKQNDAYDSLKGALSSFAFNSPNLKGKAYDSAKNYCSQVLIPLVKACILLNEAIGKACQELPVKYISEVDSVDLKESELREKIMRVDQIIGRYQTLISSQYLKKEPNNTVISNLNGSITIQQAAKQDLEEKLAKLLAYHASSPSIFSNIAGLQAAVSASIAQAKASWDSSSQSFVFPTKSNMSWATTINKQWEEYDIKDGLTDFVQGTTSISEWSKEAVGAFFEKTSSKVYKEGKNIGKSWAAKLQPKSSIGTFVKDTFKPRKWLSGKLKGLSSTTSKVIGASAKWGGRGLVAFAAYQEAKDYYEETGNIGRSISYSSVVTGVGYVAGTVGASIGGSIAVGLGAASTGLVATFAAPLVGAVVVGAIASVAVIALYKNVKPFREAVDWVGDGINKIGNAIQSSIGSLKGAFGW